MNSGLSTRIKERLFVHIIESPSPDDLLDGVTEGAALSEALKLAGIKQCYSLATDEDTFLKALALRLGRAVKDLRAFPVIHFSMHGSEEGLGLTNGHLIEWGQLGRYFKSIRASLKWEIIACISSCFSARAIGMAMSEEGDPPFHNLVGHPGSPSWGDAAVAFITFYHLLFKGYSMQDAVKGMNVAAGDEQFALFYGEDVQRLWRDMMEDPEPGAFSRAVASLADLYDKEHE